MRDRARLIEVLLSVPPGDSWARVCLRCAGRALESNFHPSELVIVFLGKFATDVESPHYRELAIEALHYLDLMRR